MRVGRKDMNRTSKTLLLVITALLLFPLTTSYAQKKSLSESEAVRLAEEFIAQNGYTDLPPVRDKIAHESIEWTSNIDELLKARHNTLERKAYGIVRERKGGASGWTVVFRQKCRKCTNGRAVTMNLDGSNRRVEHVDFILKKVDKKL
jgi:hypothetical protein